jgi:hypothetical protein
VADPHAGHDLLLVAGFAAGDLESGDSGRAEALVAACAECSALAADLGAIARATAELPAPRRPRDFFLRPADAERLRPRGLRRLAAAFRGPRLPLVRPLAGGLMMVGFAGLLLAAIPGIVGPAVVPSDRALQVASSAPPESQIQGEPGALEPSANPGPTDLTFGGAQGGSVPGGSSAPQAGRPEATRSADPDLLKSSRDTAATGPSALLLGSVVLVGIGAVLFLVSLVRTGPRGL